MKNIGHELVQSGRQAQVQTQKQDVRLLAARRMMAEILSAKTDDLYDMALSEAERNPCLMVGAPVARFEPTVTAPVDFRDELRLQAMDEKDNRIRQNTLRLIEQLDTDGFLSLSADELAMSKDEYDSALRVLRRMEPAGIGARNVRECLLLQLARKEVSADTRDMLAVVLRHYGSLLAGREALTRDLGWETERVSRTLDGLSRLWTRPPVSKSDRARYVCPDVEILYENGVFSAYPARKIELSLDGSYAFGGAFANAGRYYAERFISLVERREKIIVSVTDIAAKAQSEMLLGGKPRRLLLDDAAQRLGLTLPTVSRAILGKYFIYNGRVAPIRSLFFRSGVSGVSGAELTLRIRELIDSEGSRPLSDDGIAELLAERFGIEASRRTVAKYRHDAGIAPMRERLRIKVTIQ